MSLHHINHLDTLDKYLTISGLPGSMKDLLDRSLMNFCRETIRKHLLHVHANKNLFGFVPELPLASLMTEYLLYGVSLDLSVQMRSASSSESAAARSVCSKEIV